MRHALACAAALVSLVWLPSIASADAPLEQVTSFGANLGALDMYVHVPAGLAAGRPLVVVLHGCTQHATDLEAAGWDALADQYGFAVVYPEQRSANNPLGCFDWAGDNGDPADLTRGQGENESIIEMVDWMIAQHGSDRAHVDIAGFSAGAAFTAVMLATWPDRFAAGSIMSGVPYRCATDLATAYACESIGSHPELEKTPAQWGDLVRAADSGYAGPWPRVQIWHGSSDGTVAPENQAELVKQWTNVHGVDQTADASETIGAVSHAEYRDGATTVVETYTVSGMGHAVCMGASDASHPCSASLAYYEDHGTCSTWRAATFFGLTGGGGGGDDGGGGDGGGDGRGDAGAAAGSDRAAAGCAICGGGGAATALVTLATALGLRRRRRA